YEQIFTIRLLTLQAIAPDGNVISLLPTAKTVPDQLSLIASLHRAESRNEGIWTFSSTYDNGFYIHTADGRAIATTLADYPSAADSAHYFKFSKGLLHLGQPHQGYDRILGHRLELVPKADPFGVAVGGTLPVEVRFQGKPLANASVEIGDDHSAGRSP